MQLAGEHAIVFDQPASCAAQFSSCPWGRSGGSEIGSLTLQRSKSCEPSAFCTALAMLAPEFDTFYVTLAMQPYERTVSGPGHALSTRVPPCPVPCTCESVQMCVRVSVRVCVRERERERERARACTCACVRARTHT